ncbi:Pol polyprotein [Thelohanellus kitauei]|uniref:Pol polyprotein n=1 Tax=Thelohanellus kitauei TaxID=669202 RepID=A0A0C2NEP3_THEKT|nr:Pol polyprotein [Thelohanellus kitauei]
MAIIFINTFTKWVEAVAVRDQTSVTASKALLECIVSRFGVPDRIHSDQGRQFESELFQNICKSLGITKSRTIPYHPSGNGNVERENRTIKEMLRHCQFIPNRLGPPSISSTFCNSSIKTFFDEI